MVDRDKERQFQFGFVNVTLPLLLMKKKTVETGGDKHYWNVGNQNLEETVIHMERIKK